MFCFFAEDTGLLPKNLFTEVLKCGLDDLHHLAISLESLFAVMARGGVFGKDKIRHFNGHLFEDSSVFELTEEELKKLAEAGEADWQFIQPSIMGTLFERALEPEQRSQLGAHYTSEGDIKMLVEPVLMAPLRREWSALKGELTAAFAKGKGSPEQRRKLDGFLKKLRDTVVLDPACGSGNFLYVALQMLLGLEKEVITFATQLGWRIDPEVSVQQLRAIEINPYAYELAQVSVQIGFLQWRRDNGFLNDRTPVLQNLDGFQNEDALLVPHFRNKAKTLKEAQAGEHVGDDNLKFYTEREWPECDVIVGNPPFLGGSEIKEELGLQYQKELWRIFDGRLPGFADLCCYWFEKSREQIKNNKCNRAGLLATQSIRGGANREVLKRIKNDGNIFFAESDRPWILAGASVNVSMIGFDDGKETIRILDSKPVPEINANLTSKIDITFAVALHANHGISFQGSQKIGAFDISETLAIEWLDLPNPHARPNSDVLVPLCNGIDLTRRPRGIWIIDFGLYTPVQQAAPYEIPFKYVIENVKPERDLNPRDVRRINWWKHGDGQPAMRSAISTCHRFMAISAHTKHTTFTWLNAGILPDKALIVFARSDDFFFGVIHSRIHEIWSLKLGTQLEDRPRYTPTTCFETFPFPFPDDLQASALPAPEPLAANGGWDTVMTTRFYEVKEDASPYGGPPTTPEGHRAAIAAAAKELNDLRERWLNPPEWTETRVLQFPGTVDGPWDRYIDRSTVRDCGTFQIGTVRYPRLEPLDAECAAKLKKRTLTNLYNERPMWLDLAHKKLDAVVAAAYGWPADLTDEQILERLLALNLERAAQEEKLAKTKKTKTSREKADDELI
ncbi:MAG: DNA methyltransferase [Verrucomicrobiota bacterium]